jgi:hypothetical protein
MIRRAINQLNNADRLISSLPRFYDRWEIHQITTAITELIQKIQDLEKSKQEKKIP